MKTINVPLIGSCPQWSEDIPTARLAEFKVLVSAVEQEILSAAARETIALDHALRWHRILFSQFVPVPYYAGHLRGVDHQKPCLATQVGIQNASGLLTPGSDYRLVRDHFTSVFDRLRIQLAQFELRWTLLTPVERAYQLAVITANMIGAFIQIHPFVNGNGRTSRLLWRWCLLRFGVPPQICTHPRPTPPYSTVMDAAMRGDYRPAILYIFQYLNLNAPAQN